MRALAFLLLCWSALLADHGDFRGESYNGRIIAFNECAFLLVEKGLSKRMGLNGGYGHCDYYIDNTQDLFERSYSLLAGVNGYSADVFRDGFFIGMMLGAEYAEVDDIVGSASGERMAIKPIATIGYQWQFERGFQIALGAAVQYRIPLWSTDNIPEGDNSLAAAQVRNRLMVPSMLYRPVFLIGWRF